MRDEGVLHAHLRPTLFEWTYVLCPIFFPITPSHSHYRTTRNPVPCLAPLPRSLAPCSSGSLLQTNPTPGAVQTACRLLLLLAFDPSCLVPEEEQSVLCGACFRFLPPSPPLLPFLVYVCSVCFVSFSLASLSVLLFPLCPSKIRNMKL